jgi:nucleoside-diphosphate-sugar epimerase
VFACRPSNGRSRARSSRSAKRAARLAIYRRSERPRRTSSSSSIALFLITDFGGVWNVADEEPAPPQDVIAFAAQLLGLDPPPEEPFEGAAMSEMSRSFYEDNRRIRIDKLKREVGFQPLYPTYREGLRALARAGEGRG